jgi:molecular chaperone GrpE (heat shock protein)
MSPRSPSTWAGRNQKKSELKSANDVEYWRQRAAETREMAKFISLTEARRQMLAIADEYERTAK